MSIIKLEGDSVYKKKNNFSVILLIVIILTSFVMIYLINTKRVSILSSMIKDIIYLPTRVIDDKSILDINLNHELEEENKELKDLLKLKSSLSEFDSINAVVIERNTSYWFNTLTINKGSKDSIKKGMAVVTNEGIIGKVESTTNLTATIKLITSNDKNNKISVRINSKQDYNTVLTTNSNGEMIIEGIPNDNNIKVGDSVVTSGLSDIFPSGIAIGKVKKIELDNYGSSKKLLVESTSNINNIRFVSVLKRKV